MTTHRTTSPYSTPEFLALRQEWYAKAARSGFRDIEHIDWETGESMEMLNGMNAADMARRYDPAKEEYFRQAGWILSLLEQPDWEVLVDGRWLPWRMVDGRRRRHPLLQGLPAITREMAVRCWREHAGGFGRVLAQRRAGVHARVFYAVVNHLRTLLHSGELTASS